MGIELPTELAGVAAKTGVQWPQADEEAMRASAQAWRQAGTRMSGVSADADGTANKALSAVRGDAGDAARTHWNGFVAPDSGHLTSTVAGCNAAADRLEHAADQIGAAKAQIVSHLVTLAKTDDAAREAASAGHPTALLGLNTAVRGTAANVANVHQNLTQAVRLDSGVTMPSSTALVNPTSPAGGHGGLVSGLTSTVDSTTGLTGHGASGLVGATGQHAGDLVGATGQNVTGLVSQTGHGAADLVGGAGQQVHDLTGAAGQQVTGLAGAGQQITGQPLGDHGQNGPGGPGDAGGQGAVGVPGVPGVSGGQGLSGGQGIAGLPGGGHGLGQSSGFGPGSAGDVDPGAHTGPVSIAPTTLGSSQGHGLTDTGAPTPPMGTTVQSLASAPSAAAAPAPISDFAPTPPAGIPAQPGVAPTFDAGLAGGGAAGAVGGVGLGGPAAGSAGGGWAPTAGPVRGDVAGGGGFVGASPTRGPSASSSRTGQGADFYGEVDAAGAPGTARRTNLSAPRPAAPLAGSGGVSDRPTPAAPPSGEVALFLVYLFPIGHLPVASSKPTRQLPPPPAETDYAAGLRFPPHDHPRSDLVDDTEVLGQLIEARLAPPPGSQTPTPPTGEPLTLQDHPIEPDRVADELDPAGLGPDHPAVRTLTESYDPLGGGSERDWDHRFLVRPAEPELGQAAEYAWPPGEFRPEGGCAAGEPVVLPEGTLVDRFGSADGRVFAADGTPFRRRSLPPDALTAGYHRYRVLRELPVWQAMSAAWFDQPGGGVRYRAGYPVADLVALGYLEELGAE
ncbi:MAG TPA: glycohydrolase toxin TNT-related protein [Pseudonocardiaceae bacterium]|nr:glycohydrolase toxin TNT-related protein [Pseudonocardiaceae bacterium]